MTETSQDDEEEQLTMPQVMQRLGGELKTKADSYKDRPMYNR